jgi:geranylgeranyl diphosphate synthase type II
VADDILNVMSTPEQLGKAVGTDQAHRKNTYPALLGLEPAQQYARTLIDDALQALTFFDNKAEPLRALARYIIERRR